MTTRLALAALCFSCVVAGCGAPIDDESLDEGPEVAVEAKADGPATPEGEWNYDEADVGDLYRLTLSASGNTYSRTIKGSKAETGGYQLVKTVSSKGKATYWIKFFAANGSLRDKLIYERLDPDHLRLHRSGQASFTMEHKKVYWPDDNEEYQNVDNSI